jgi:signal transduction histidine kinase
MIWHLSAITPTVWFMCTTAWMCVRLAVHSVMRLTSSFLQDYRSAGRPPVQQERVLAVGRAFLTVSGFVAIYLDPTEPSRLRAVTYSVLLAYALYSLAVMAYVHGPVRLTPVHGRLLHGLDIFWTAALTFVSEGPVSPFFLFFLFVVLAAAYRGGFRETLGTAVLIVAVFLVETSIAARGPWNSTWFASIGFELNSTILRVAYLLMTGVLLGYLAEQDKQSRAELAAIADATRQPRVNIGLGGSVTALARMLLTTFGAKSVSVVVYDHESRRTLLWQVHRSQTTDQPSVRRLELNADQQAVWLFQDFGRAWHAAPLKDGDRVVVRVTEPEVWRLKRVRVPLPQGPFSAPMSEVVTVVNMGLSGEWQARIYLVDTAHTDNLARSLHFLEALAEHVTPALTNVFLLRRLRARAGAVERARVARELHDGAIQALYGIELKLEAFKRSADRSPAFVDKELGEVQELLRREVLSLRELMQALRPLELEGADQLPDVLAALVERFRRDTGISARFVPVGRSVALAPAKALEVVRIVQEALANVRRHSGARNVLVSLTGDNGGCRLVIEDDGCGFDFEGRFSAPELDRRRIGPAVIKERARLAGAQLAVDSAPGAGTRIELAFNEEVAHG